MKKSSEVLGLKVIGIKEGQENGITQDFLIDPASKSVKYLLLKRSAGYGYRLMKTGDIGAIGADYVITGTVSNVLSISSSAELAEEVENGYFILGAKVLSSTGDIIGEVTDFSFDEKSGSLDVFMLDNGAAFGIDEVDTLSGHMVFMSPDGVAAQLVYEEPVEAAAIGEEVVFEEPALEVVVEEPVVEVIEEEYIVVEEEPPARTALEQESINFLMGKTVNSDVVSDDGMFRLDAGTELTEEIINLAEQHDAILTLTLSV